MEEKKPFGKASKILICIGVIAVYLLGTFNAFRIAEAVDLETIIGNAPSAKKSKTIEDYITRNFYKEVDDSILEDARYRGMLDSLNDPYSSYFTKEEYEAFNSSTTSSIYGIGAQLSKDPETGEVVVIRVYSDTPAQEAGITEGDIILSADGVSGKDMDLETFVQLVRGPENSNVSLEIKRGDETFTVKPTRRQVFVPSVYYNMLEDGVGYVQVTSFGSNTDKEFMEAMTDLETQGMEYVIYDLRSNPGGLVSTVTDMLDDILPEGLTVYMEDRYGSRSEFNSDEEHQLNYPCVVLVDEHSASASEIFCGAIRDHEWGILLGTTTQGKGVVQNIYTLPDGSAVKITVAEYFTPNGTAINGIGFTPDVIMEYEYDAPEDKNAPYDYRRDKQVMKAIEILRDGLEISG